MLWTGDIAPYARARDRRVTVTLADAGVRALPQGGAHVVDVRSTARLRSAACSTIGAE